MTTNMFCFLFPSIVHCLDFLYYCFEHTHEIRYLHLYYHCVDTSVGGLFFQGVRIIRPIVSVSALTWFIRYIIIEISLS
jgi:hypothetical protein